MAIGLAAERTSERLAELQTEQIRRLAGAQGAFMSTAMDCPEARIVATVRGGRS